jgi:outer membrane protein TolC
MTLTAPRELSAQNKEPGSSMTLTLDKALELALANSLDLQQQFIDLRTAKTAADNLWSQVFPSFSARAGMSYGTQLASGTGFQMEKDNLGWSASLGLTMPLRPSLASGMKATELAYRSQLLGYEDARNQMIILISKKFFRLLTDKEALAILEGNLRLAEGQLEKSAISFRNGLVRELDYLQSQLSLEDARLKLSQAEADYAIGLGEFLTILGLAQDTSMILEGRVGITRIEAEAETLIREYLPRRPDIISRRQAIEGSEYAEKQQILNNRAPSLSLSATWGARPAGSVFPGEFSDSFSGDLTLNIPIDSWISGTESNQTVKRSGAETEKSRLALKNTETNAMQEIRTFTANLKNSWGNIEIARLRVDLAERTYRLSEQGYQNGTVEYQDLETSRNTLASVRQQLLEEELAYKTMMLNLSAALNIEEDELVAGWGAGSIP